MARSSQGIVGVAFLAFVILASAAWRSASAADSEPLAARQLRAQTLIREALQREVYGALTERSELLEQAEQADVVSRPARWHQGLVQSPTGRWIAPESYLHEPGQKRSLQDYRKTRAAAADTVNAQLTLANWCAQHALAAQERSHLWRVITLDPEHAEARRRLGFEQVGKEWFTAEDAKAMRDAEAAHKEALDKYREPLQEILRDLTHRSPMRQASGRKKLDELADPAALPAIEAVLGSFGGEVSTFAVEKISQFDGQEPARALCRFALFTTLEPVRTLAIAKLRQREKGDYIPELLDLLSQPLQSRFIAVPLRGGLTNYQHIVIREGRDRRDVAVFDRQFLSHIEAIPERNSRGTLPSPQDTRMIRQAAADAEARDGIRDATRIAADREMQILQANTVINQINRQVMDILVKTTDKQYITPHAWWQWWLEESDRIQNSKRTTLSRQYTSKIALSAIKYRRTYSQPMGSGASSCFAAGTLVWTTDGAMPIEKIEVGDMVLAKDIESGELCYKPVLETTVRQPSPLITFKVGAETIFASRGHLFWQSGTGWTQARRLQYGMLLHAAGAPVRVTNWGEAPPQPTYNLVVADFNTYFVGEEKVLTHDVTEEEPTDVVVPGLSAE